MSKKNKARSHIEAPPGNAPRLGVDVDLAQQEGVNPTRPIQPDTRGRSSAEEGPKNQRVQHGDSKGFAPGAADFPIVGVGASAGGLEAFTQLLRALPSDTGMGFVLVQHLDPQHESALTQILSRATSLPVTEIADNEPVEPNHVYVIPPDTNLSIERGVLKLAPRPSGRAPHRPIDSFFESLATDRRERAIGVVLSGTASDGTLGLEVIKAEGGITFAQDDSAKHESMPRSAIASGSVDLVLSPTDIAKELARIAEHPFVAGPFELRSEVEGDRTDVSQGELDRAQATAHEDDDTALPSGGQVDGVQRPRAGKKKARAGAKGDEPAEGTVEAGYKIILLLLRNHSGVDFSLYKSTTIQRRITRRLVLGKQPTLDDYATFLKGNAKELNALYSDVLISVTSFFRNPETFESIQREVLPALLKQRSDEPIRCWVLGCSTGQEAYSIAMAFVEVAEKATHTRQLQVFATDLNEALLDKARHGLYAKSLAEDISPQRLRRFFTEEEGGYRISKSLRELVVFARQNLIADPPFSRMDLISCRNLLIYLEPSLQKKAIPTFHYALRPGGYLLLGASESIGGFTELFEPVDKKHKIYTKKAAPTPAFHLPLGRGHGDPLHVPGMRASRPATRFVASGQERTDGLRSELSAQREADRVAVNQYAPPGVLINAENQVLQFRGPTGAYLEPPAGKASFDVLKMAREGLMMPLRAAINEASKENKSARRENVRFQRNGEGGGTRTVNLEVIPLRNLPERCFLVVFEEPDKARHALTRQPARPPLSKSEEKSRVAELETDLSETREYLQAMQEQGEAANEELQASNEEVQSANEELQSVNEELETSKEELESANEELTTVNDEMSNRNVELNRLNNDLVNLQTSTKLAIVLLGRDLALRRFSPQAEKQFGLLASDVGRPIGHIRHNLIFTARAEPASPESESRHSEPRTKPRECALDVESMASEVITSVREQDCEVQDNAGRWHQLRVRPYMTLDGKVDGAVLVLMDIDQMKRAEQIVADARNYAENTIATVREPLLVLDNDLRVESANHSFYRAFHVTPKETVGTLLYNIGNREWDIPRLRELLDEIIQKRTAVEDFQVENDFETIGKRTMLLNARRVFDPQRTSERILLAIEDITERVRSVTVLRDSEGRYRTLTEQVKDYAIFRTDVQGRALTWNKGVKRVLGFDEQDFLGQDIIEAIFTPEDVQSGVAQQELDTAAAKGTAGNDRWMRRKNGEHFFANGVTTALKDETGELIGFTKVMRDATERAQAESLIQCQKESLELLVKGEPIERVLDFLARSMESQSQGRFLAAIHLMEADGHHFGYVAAPSLQTSYAQATKGLDARLELGACSSAVVSHEPTVVRDFAAETRWPAFTAEVLSLGLRGCFTTPILSADRRVLGTFAMYYREPGDPSPHDQQLVNLVTSTVVLAIERKRVEQALHENEERFRTLFDSAPMAVFVCDANAVIQHYNHRAAELWGREPTCGVEQHCGSTKLWLPNGMLLPHDQSPMVDVLRTGVPAHNVEVFIERPDGSRLPVLVNFAALTDAHGQVTGAITSFIDITERKQAERALRASEERFRMLSDNIPQLAWIADPGTDGEVHWFNRSWLDYTGSTLEDMQGSGWQTVHHPDHADRVIKKFQQHVREGLDWEDTFPLRGKDGQYHWFLSRMKCLRDESGKVVRIFGTNTDVTEQRAMQDRINHQAEQLAGESRRKDEFLAMLSHELRNPLAPIRSAVHLLKLHERSSENPIQRQAREIIERQTANLSKLVDDLLEVSRVVSGRIRLSQQTVDLNQVVRHAIETATPLIDDHQHELVLNLSSAPVWTNADATRIEEVIINVLNNAAKYTPNGGRIEVHCERNEGQGVAQVRVRDNGVGIEPELLRGGRLFDLFTQADRSLARSSGGLGIGLSLAHRLVELHGGTLEVKSPPEAATTGSEFTVTLTLIPAPESEQLSAPTDDAAPGAVEGVRVLVVDDNIDQAMMVAAALRLEGYSVQSVYNGLDGLKVAQQWRPDIVLLDIGLPGMDGYEIARRLRADPTPGLRQARMIALTGYGRDTDIDRAKEAGFDAHLTKPFDLRELAILIAAQDPRSPR